MRDEEVAESRQDDRGPADHHGVRDPLELLTLVASRSAQAHKRCGGRQRKHDETRQPSSTEQTECDAEGSVGIDADRILRRREIGCSGRQRPRSEHATEDSERRQDDRRPCYPPPASRQQTPVRKNKHEEGDGTCGKEERLLPGGEPDGPDTARQRTAMGDQCVERIFVGDAPNPMATATKRNSQPVGLRGCRDATSAPTNPKLTAKQHQGCHWKPRWRRGWQ